MNGLWKTFSISDSQMQVLLTAGRSMSPYISAGSLYLDAQDLPMVRPMTVIWEYVFWEMTTKVSGSERLSMTAADTEQ